MLLAAPFHTYMEEDFDKAINQMRQDGFDAIGLYIDREFEFYYGLKEKLIECKMPICLHADINDTNIASVNKGIREESMKQAKQTIDFARDINANVVTIHPGKYGNKYKEDGAYRVLYSSLCELEKYAGEVNLAMENMEPEKNALCVNVEDVKKVIEEHPKLTLCFDAAHAAMVQEDYLEYWDLLLERISHVHLSGVNGRNSHVEVSLAESLTDFSPMIKELKKFNGVVLIENRDKQKAVESLGFFRNVIEAK